LLVLAVAVLGTGLTLIVNQKIQRSREQVARVTFRDAADDRITAGSRSVYASLRDIRTVSAFAGSGADLDTAGLKRLAQAVLRRGGIIETLTVWEASPSVTGPQLSLVQRIVGGPRGSLGSAPRADVYQSTLDPAMRALRSGLPTASGPLAIRTLDGSEVTGSVYWCPVQTTPGPGDAVAKRYLIAATLRPHLAVREPEGPRAGPPLTVRVRDVEAPAGLPTDAGEQALARVIEPVSQTIAVGGRQWRVTVAASPGFVAAHAPEHGATVMATGLGLTALLSLLLLTQWRLAGKLAREATQRAAANVQLAEQVKAHEDAQRALAAANQQLVRANEEMEQFVSSVTHDLKSPLVEATLTLDQAQSELEAGRSGDLGHSLQEMGGSFRRMRRLIDNLLEHHRAGWARLNAKPTDLTQLVMQVFESHHGPARRRGVNLQVSPDLPTLRVDQPRFAAALDNLVGNAIKHGGSEPNPTVGIAAEIGPREVTIVVEDNGCGLPEDSRERVFGLFERGNSKRDGTGIGLAIVRRVAEAHGGRAWIDSSDDGMCRVCISLPIDALVRPGGQRHAAGHVRSLSSNAPRAERPEPDADGEMSLRDLLESAD
jgi:signal transduction histidine kinase